MFKRVSLYPPLAFARVGSSPTPCENFYWGPDDLTPLGTARTQIIGWDTLVVAENGTVAVRPPSPSGKVVFKDEHGLRPVCPFFEVHAVWEEDGKDVERPLTKALLESAGLKATDLRWQVEIANLKAHHLTGAAGDRFGASLEVAGGDFRRQELKGTSPDDDKALVPAGRHIPLGFVQATQPAGECQEFRLRFTPPAGKVYAPSNFAARLAALGQPSEPVHNAREAMEMILGGADANQVLKDYALSHNLQWRGFELPPDQCLLNQDAVWPSYNLLNFQNLFLQAKDFLPRLADLQALGGAGDRSEFIRALLGRYTDVGNLPPGLFAFAAEPPGIIGSLGLVDDMGDGAITVRLGDLAATSRVVIAPPSFAPDRRLPVSLADGLADRVDRARVRNEAWITGNEKSAGDEVADLLDRAYETAGLQNMDAVVNFFREENRNRALRRDSAMTPQQAADLLWDGSRLGSVQSLPLAAHALQRHRRNTTRLYFDIFARENKKWFERWIRPPADPQRFYDKRMPGLMRGFDRRPLHLTRRQYEALKAWSKWKVQP
jgi:hypothetical protein